MNHTSLCIALIAALFAAGCDRRAEPETAPAPEASAPAPAPAPAPVEPAVSPVVTSETSITASTTLTPTMGNTAGGQITFTPENGAVRLRGALSGLAPNTGHGFHVHETGDCSAPDASSAGAHFNPDGHPHGNAIANTAPHHAGDIPNVSADAQGNASVDALIQNVGLGSNDARDIVGKALVVHEKADDYTTQPSGDSGARIACGVIASP